ncbi:flagellar hook capping FlgD N-terminal domain-containing protein [Roseobacter sp.]|uniref:flagellar hook capping FlgD N-terminal domain-containing protein n=1 Tax=Roseobacter sp. TaxID=1907202 RepID=UPI0026001F13|nr:flagellar hook capping FlgD N-terminal domain-containing protein [Roseobacter sp.]
MDVTQSQPTQTAAPTPAVAGSTAVISSDFETFLQMLTAQARYQDPLEPIDSSEYAAQLAQFSMVEQQVLSNDLLTALGDQLGAGNIAQMAGWIGMEARTTAAVAFEGSPLTIIPKADPGAEEAVLVVLNETGEEAQRLQIATDGEPLEWAGVSAGGDPLPPGNYRFMVESRTAGEVTTTSPAETYARITEARREAGGTMLILHGGSAVTTADVAALREAPGTSGL